MEEDSGHRDIENRDAALTLSARAPSGASIAEHSDEPLAAWLLCAAFEARFDAETSARLKRAAAMVSSHDALRAALRCFIVDERFHVSVGGNPNAVETMLAEARAALENAGGA